MTWEIRVYIIKSEFIVQVYLHLCFEIGMRVISRIAFVGRVPFPVGRVIVRIDSN